MSTVLERIEKKCNNAIALVGSEKCEYQKRVISHNVRPAHPARLCRDCKEPFGPHFSQQYNCGRCS